MDSQKRNSHLLEIRKHNGACADPTGFVKDIPELLKRRLAKDKNGQVCASFIEDGKRWLMSFDGVNFTNLDISEVPDSDLVNAASQEQTFDRVQAKLSIFKNKFAHGTINGVSFNAFDPDLYRLNFVRQGEQVVVPAEPDAIVACILAAMHPTYYDFNVFDDKYEDNVNYSIKKSKNVFEHSGDILEANTLLHFAKLKNNKNMNHRMSLFITGYHNTPLEKFELQSPANLLFDHEQKIIHIIEFPLDAASVGNATLGIPGVGQIRNGKLYFDVFTKPETGSGSAPNYDSGTIPLLKAAVSRFSICNETSTALTAGHSTPKEVALQEKGLIEEGIEGKEGPHILHVHVGNVMETNSTATHLIKMIGGVSCYLNGDPDKRVHREPLGDLGKVTLPGLLGPIEGPFICLAAQSIIGTGASPHDLGYFKNCFPIITVTTEMTDSARQTVGNKRINGIFIIESDTPIDTLEKLAMVNKNAVTALAGPMSLVLVKYNKKYYYMEGINMKGLVDEVPEFGDIMHFNMNQIEDWALQNCIDDPIVDITKETAKIQDKSYTLPEIVSLMETLSIDEILSMKQSILCMYYQLTKIYDDEELQKFGKQLYTILDKILTTPPKNTEELRKLQEQFKNGKTKMKVSPMYQKTKEEYAKKRKQLKFLMDKVSSLLSEKNSSSKSMTHKQLKRFNAIKSNYDMMKNMTRSDFEENVELSCSEMGVLVCAGEPVDLKNFISTIGKNRMKETLSSDSRIRLAQVQNEQTIIEPIMELSARQQMLDALTATCLLQLTTGEGPLHSQDNSITLSIPESNDSTRGAVLIPLLDRFVNMKNPYNGNWINLCNDPDVAMFRLLMRNTFIKASVGRELTDHIEPASKDLGWGIVNIYLDIMQQLKSNRQTAMTEANFDETLCQQIRCLFGLILTQLAAGQDPISLIWQLWRGENTRPDLPMQSWHWTLYLEMAHMMQFTGWPQTIFKRNLKILLVRTLNSKIAYPMCDFLRAEKVQMKKSKYGEEYKKKLQEIYYPTKMRLTKTTLTLLEVNETPSKAFLTEYENIFNQFPNSKVRKRGIKTILTQLTLWNKYGEKYQEKSKQHLHQLCTKTVEKNEPKLKICRHNLKKFTTKALSDEKAPQEHEVKIFKIEWEDLNKTIDNEKNVGFAIVLKKMKNVLKFLENWSAEKDNGEKKHITKKGMKIATDMVETMYDNLEYGCWNLKDKDNNTDIALGDCIIKKDKDEERGVMDGIFENKSNKLVSLAYDIVETKLPLLERVSKLAKLVDIGNASVLIRLAGLAGFGQNSETVQENLILIVKELFYRWETDPDVLEILIADKHW